MPRRPASKGADRQVQQPISLQYIASRRSTTCSPRTSAFFDTMGQNLFRSFATILLAWFGIKSALASASGRPAFHFDHFASLLLTISFGFAMVNYYSAPIPGIGTSFHNLVTDEVPVPVEPNRPGATANGGVPGCRL